jgi:glutamate--cysteine ligase
LHDWGLEICDGMVGVAQLIDPDETLGHVDAIRSQRALLADPDGTPSARLLADLQRSGLPLAEYGVELAVRTRDYFRSLPGELNSHRAKLVAESGQSRQRQLAIEQADHEPFAEYLAAYFA